MQCRLFAVTRVLNVKGFGIYTKRNLDWCHAQFNFKEARRSVKTRWYNRPFARITFTAKITASQRIFHCVECSNRRIEHKFLSVITYLIRVIALCASTAMHIDGCRYYRIKYSFKGYISCKITIASEIYQAVEELSPADSGQASLTLIMSRFSSKHTILITTEILHWRLQI